MVGDNYVTKSNLTITVKTLTKYNDRSRVAAKQTNKQTNRLRDKETNKHLGRKIKKKDILSIRLTVVTIRITLTVDTHTERGKQKMKMSRLMLCCY